jgi:hypothetical protein
MKNQMIETLNGLALALGFHGMKYNLILRSHENSARYLMKTSLTNKRRLKNPEET